MVSKMNKLTIWFNHWFSSAYHLITLLKENKNFDLHIIGSNKNDFVVYRNVCDEWYVEPGDKISAEDYINFALDFCKEHHVDVFFVRRFQKEIVEKIALFDSIGVKLFAENNAEALKIIDDKGLTYSYLKEYIPECIPSFKIAHNLNEFISSYQELAAQNNRVCYKLTIDEGAASFRVIDNNLTSIDNLLSTPGHKIKLEDALKIMEQYDFSIPVLLMPFLDGVEVSVDCLKTASGNIIIPRFKTNKRYSEIYFKKEIIAYCEKIMNIFSFEYPLNVQFKKSGDTYYLLEINCRMSGGLQLSWVGTGVNIPSIALSKVCGVDEKYEIHHKSSKVVHIESPVKFN